MNNKNSRVTQQQEVKKQSSNTPPYLSLSALEKLFFLLSTRKIQEFNAGALAQYGFSRFDASAAVVALRFLTLIDAEGKATEELPKLQLQGEPKQQALQALIKKAYSKLYDRVPEPYKLPTQEIRNDFISVYRISPRIAQTAAPAFIWLCVEAGLLEKGIKPRRRTSTSGERLGLSSRSLGENHPRKSVVTSSTKLDVIREFLGKVDPNTLDVAKFKEMAAVIEGLLALAESDGKNEEGSL